MTALRLRVNLVCGKDKDVWAGLTEQEAGRMPGSNHDGTIVWTNIPRREKCRYKTVQEIVTNKTGPVFPPFGRRKDAREKPDGCCTADAVVRPAENHLVRAATLATGLRHKAIAVLGTRLGIIYQYKLTSIPL